MRDLDSYSEHAQTLKTKESSKLHIVGLPRQVAHYETLRTLLGLVILELLLFLAQHLASMVILDKALLAAQILVVIVGLIEILLNYRRLTRHTEITVTDKVVMLRTGRWVSTSAVTRLSLVISVGITQGPILKAMGLSQLAIRSIGPAPTVPPLPIELAERIQSIAMTESARP